MRAVLVETFATTYSLAMQHTLHAMGRAALEAHDELVEVSLSAPNKHHHLVDLAPFGLDNPGEVFIAADRPYGLIEATVLRERRRMSRWRPGSPPSTRPTTTVHASSCSSASTCPGGPTRWPRAARSTT